MICCLVPAEVIASNNKEIIAIEPSNHIALENNNISSPDIAEFSDDDDAPLSKS